MILSDELKTALLNHVTEAKNQEACGLIIEKNQAYFYLKSDNQADNPCQSFLIGIDDFIHAEKQGTIKAVFHSHPNGELWLSGADRQMQVKTALPWILAVGGELKYFKPVAHLRGRVFNYGVFDCYRLIQDAYHLMGIDLIEVRRTDLNQDANLNLFEKMLPETGFYRTEHLKIGDVLLSSLKGQANHIGLYLGNNQVLHHAFNQLSRVEAYHGYWQRYQHSIWRHQDWQKNRIDAVHHDLMHTN